MPETGGNPCALCGVFPEARPGCRLCHSCLEVASRTLRAIQSESLPEYISAGHLRQWAATEAQQTLGQPLMVVLLRGLIQGVIMAADIIQEGASVQAYANWGKLVHLEAAAMQALAEVRG